MSTLRELAGAAARLLPAIEARLWPGAADADWWAELHRLIAECSQRAGKRIAIVQRLALHAGNLARMEYDFLFDETRNLLAIGYNVDDRRRDSSYYDLLASEARLSPSWPSRRGSCRRKLVCPGPKAHQRRWQTDPALVERIDVRVPDASLGDADL